MKLLFAVLLLGVSREASAQSVREQPRASTEAKKASALGAEILDSVSKELSRNPTPDERKALLAALLQAVKLVDPDAQISREERFTLEAKLKSLGSEIRSLQGKLGSITLSGNNALGANFHAELKQSKDVKVKEALSRIETLDEAGYRVALPCPLFEGRKKSLGEVMDAAQSPPLRELLEIEKRLTKDLPVPSSSIKLVEDWVVFMGALTKETEKLFSDLEILRAALNVRTLNVENPERLPPMRRRG